MKAFTFTAQEGFEWIKPLNEADFERFRHFNGTPKSELWKPIPMRLITSDEAGVSLAKSDMPWLGRHAPVLRQRAWVALHEVLSCFGEFLPLRCEGSGLHLFNTTTVIDALDEDRSTLIL